MVHPRFGQISFLNVLPVVLPIERKCVQLDAEFCYDEPAQLNKALDAGALDVSAVSSFYYLQNKELDLVPGISISCLKEVGSVLLFSKVHPAKLGGAGVAVPASSATSVALLKILLAQKYGVGAELIRIASGFEESGVEAVCVFGDHALEVDVEWSKHYQRFDLGTWWHELTGLPMVFGVWAASKSWSQKNPGAIDYLSLALAKAAGLGLGDMLDDVVAEARRRCKLTAERLKNYYLRQLSFDLSADHLEGLKTFQRLCHKHGLL